MTETKTKVTITLEGMERKHFDAIKKHIVEAVPGLDPSNTDVARHALYLATKSVVKSYKTDIDR